MAYLDSPVAGISYPDINTQLSETRDAIELAVRDIERLVVIPADNLTDLNTKVGTPTEGMVAWLRNNKHLLVYNGSAWVRVYPATPAIHVGATAPSSALGENGDIYFRSA